MAFDWLAAQPPANQKLCEKLVDLIMNIDFYQWNELVTSTFDLICCIDVNWC